MNKRTWSFSSLGKFVTIGIWVQIRDHLPISKVKGPDYSFLSLSALHLEPGARLRPSSLDSPAQTSNQGLVIHKTRQVKDFLLVIAAAPNFQTLQEQQHRVASAVSVGRATRVQCDYTVEVLKHSFNLRSTFLVRSEWHQQFIKKFPLTFQYLGVTY